MSCRWLARVGLIGWLASALLAETAAAAIPSVERDALIALYNATNGAGWSERTNWRNPGDTDFNDPGTECTWHGVTCDAGGTTVIGIDLAIRNLNGPIPPELGDLTNLETLDLATNDLSGALPSELANLANLVELDLSYNDLTGSLPSWLGGLSELQVLTFENNTQMTGTIPPELGSLADLRILNLRCELTGSIPPELGNLASLEELYLDANELTGSIPPELGDLSNLTVLGLSGNELSGPLPPEIGGLANLEVLDLKSCGLSGPLPPAIGGLTSLRVMDVAENHHDGGLPPELGMLSNLEEIQIDGNMFDGEIPAEIKDLTALLDGYSGFLYNALHSSDQTVIDFVNAKQKYYDWRDTQTVAPVNVVTGAVGDETVWLSWDAVAFQSQSGGYEVFSAPSGTDAWVSGGWTSSKSETTFPVTGLAPGAAYDFVVRTRTDDHAQNPNLVRSDPSAVVVQTTASLGCSAPDITLTKGDQTVLSVPDVYDSYLWSTGDTTSRIVISGGGGGGEGERAPKKAEEDGSEAWYWVSVTSAGSCEESAVIFVDGGLIFTDGLESGDTSIWSATVSGP